MSTPTGALIAGCEYWMRVGLALQLCVKEALLTILHNRDADKCYTGLPEDETDLYNCMVAFKGKCQNSLKNVIRQDQWDVLCPSTGKSNSGDWDITVIVVVVQYETNLPPPNGGWKKKIPQVNDNSKAAFCLHARQLRNEYNHGSMNDLSTQHQFNIFWANIEKILIGLCYNKMNMFKELESGSLKLYTSNIVQVLEDRMLVQESSLLNLETEKVDVNTSVIALIQIEVDLLKSFDIQSQEKEEEMKGRLTRLEERIRRLNESSKAQEEKEKEMKSRLTCLEENIKRSTESSKASDRTVKAALHIVADKIDNDWCRLAYALGMTVFERLKIEAMVWLHSWQYTKSNKDKMMTFFENRLFQISWWELKEDLKNLERKDIVDEILDETVVLKEVDDAIKTYKDELFEALRVKQEQCSFNGPDGSPMYESMERQRSFVELAITNQVDVDYRWLNSDRDYHIHQMAAEMKSISMEDILTTDDKFVVVNGIAGIGKSTLLEMLVYRWSNGTLLNGLNEKSPNIKLLLFMRCRDLNWMDIDENTSVEEIFPLIFRRLFNHIDLRSFEEIRKNILVVIDGIDELRGFDKHFDSRDEKIEPITKFILCLVNPNPNGCFPGKSVIVAGRPGACQKLKKKFEKHAVMKKIEVCGFNSDGVRSYLKQRFNSDLSDSILTNIRESETISIMVRIPVYLWVVTALYKESNAIPKVETTTELLLYACLVFIRNHYKNENCVDMSLEEICDNQKVLKHLTVLSEFSYRTLKEKKVLFPLEDFKDPNLEDTGFVVKSKAGEFGETYQFRHLVLQELFCALYLFFYKFLDWNDLSLEGCLRGCVPLAAGLQGLYVTERNPLLSHLLRKLLDETGVTKCSSIMEFLEQEAVDIYENLGVTEHRRFSLQIILGMDTYVEGFFEYHSSLSEEMDQYFKMNTNGLQITFSREPAIIRKWRLFYIEKYCNCKSRKPLFLRVRYDVLTENEAAILTRYTSSVEGLNMYLDGIDYTIKTTVFETLFLKRLADNLNAIRIPLKEFVCVGMPHQGHKAEIARIIPHARHLELSVNLIKLALDSIEKIFFTHRKVYVEHLLISGGLNSMEDCRSLVDLLGDQAFDYRISREDMSKLFQYFDSISIRPFGNSRGDNEKVLEFLENSNSHVEAIKVKKLELNFWISDETFSRLIDDFRLVEELILKESFLTRKSVDFLEKTLREWKLSNVKCNLKSVEITTSSMLNYKKEYFHKDLDGVDIKYISDAYHF